MIKILYGALALIVLLVITAFVLPNVMNWDSYKPEISERVKALTGRSLAIDGDIDIDILPTPKLRISDVRLANIAGATASDMVRLRALDFKLALGPLLSGNFQLSRLKLIEPVIEFERLADGKENWKFTPADEGAGSTDAGTEVKTAEDKATAFSLDSMSIVNGTLVYRDSASGQVEYIQHLKGTLSAKTFDGPFRGEGSMKVRGLETEFKFISGRKHADGHIPISFKAKLSDGLAQIGFDGKLAIGEVDRKGFGTLRASGNNLADLIDALDIGDVRQLVAEKFSLKSEVALSQSGATLDDLQFRIGDTQASGAIAYAMDTPARLEATIEINRLDLDKISENSALRKSARDGGTLAGDNRGEISDIRASALADESKLAAYLSMLPDDIAATFDLSVQTLRYRGDVVQQAHAVFSLDEGVITVQQAVALLPGGSHANLFGQLLPNKGSTRFDGQVEIVSDDVRAIISWLDLMEPNDIPNDRLRRFSMVATISASEHGGKLPELDVTIDASRLTGFANFTLGARNQINANLHLNRLNVNAYLSNGNKPDTSASEIDSGETDSRDTGISVTTAKNNDSTFLDTLDANLNLTAGRLSYGGAILSDITLEGTFQEQVLTVKRLDVADLSGATVALSGEIHDPTGQPNVNFTFDVQADSILGLIRVAGIGPRLRANNLGKVHISGNLSGGRKAVNLDAQLDTRPAKILLIGSIRDPLADAALNLGLELRARDTAELLRAVDIVPPKLATRVGALAIDGGLDGRLEALNMSLSANAAGNHLQVIGHLADFLDAGRYNLTFNLANPSFSALAKLLNGEPYDGEAVGEVRLKGRLAGDNASANLSDLSLALGKTRMLGDADMVWDGPIPVLRANFDSSFLDVGSFMRGAMARNDATPTDSDASSSGNRQANAGRHLHTLARHLPNEPFDLASLAKIKADVSVAAKAILAGDYRVNQAEFNLRVTDGALEIVFLRGHIFDGLLEARGKIANTVPPQVNFAFKLDNVDLAAALHKAGDINMVAGRARLDGRFTSQGYNEHEMVRALNGKTTLKAANGTVEGLDLHAFSDQLGRLNDPTHFFHLAREELSSGTTRLNSLNGTVYVRNGLATTNDLTLIADSGRGIVHGKVDLPNWQLDLTALFRLTDYPNAPPVGVRISGAIDSPARELLLADMQVHIAKTASLPKLHEDAKSKPGSREDKALRDFFGDPGDSTPNQTTTPLVESERAHETTPKLGPVLDPIPKRGENDPLSPQDILKGVLDIPHD